MFRKTNDTQPLTDLPASTDRVTSVIGPGVVWKGKLSGKADKLFGRMAAAKDSVRDRIADRKRGSSVGSAAGA